MSGQCHWVDSGCGGMMMLVSHEWEHGDTCACVAVAILILITLMVLHVFFCGFLFERGVLSDGVCLFLGQQKTGTSGVRMRRFGFLLKFSRLFVLRLDIPPLGRPSSQTNPLTHSLTY